jgi:hypothetical protein
VQPGRPRRRAAKGTNKETSKAEGDDAAETGQEGGGEEGCLKPKTEAVKGPRMGCARVRPRLQARARGESAHQKRAGKARDK